MKFLVVSHHLPPKYRAGAELYALRQARWLQSKGHTVRAIAVEDIEAPVARLEVRHEPYQGLEIDRLYFNRLSYPNPLEASHLNPEIAAWLEEFLEQYQPDVMLVNACYLLGVGILQAARNKGVPVALTLHDFWFLCQRITLMQPDGTLCDGKVTSADCALCLSKDKRRYLWANKLTGGLAGRSLVAGAEAGLEPFLTLLGGKQKLETLALRRERLLAALQGVETVIAPSRYLRQIFIENGFPAEKIHCCRCGLDTERLAQLEHALVTRGTSNRTATGLRVGYMGQITPHKGVHVLLKAFQQFENPQASLSIHGAMGREPRYDRQLQQLAGADQRIRFAGAYNPEELPNILLGLDVVVVPSIWLENSPVTILEAHAAGLPVITTNLGGMAEMVQHEHNGLLFERQNAHDLANQLRRLQSEPELLARLKAGIAPVKSHDQEFSELLPIYETLVASRV
jgi:glycosyltransferase involved in cell wall biosynthesis